MGWSKVAGYKSSDGNGNPPSYGNHNPTWIVTLGFGKHYACNDTISQKEQEQCP